MNRVDLVNQYFHAWNAHDPGRIAATFIEGGTYRDPSTDHPLRGEQIAAYAEALFAAFPDVTFERVSESMSDTGLCAVQWVMRGTNTGPMEGIAPTGRSVQLDGADFLVLDQDGIRSVHGHFDRRSLMEQLGLAMIVRPPVEGPFEFGVATRVTVPSSAVPGAFSLTWIEVASAAEMAEVGGFTRQIVSELTQTPGFLGWIGVTVGHRMITVTAWQGVEDVQRLSTHGTHKDAVRRFFDPEFGAPAAATSVWIPHHVNAVWVRCSSCGRLIDYAAHDGVCACGTQVAAPHYW
jgi:steroid delta-isomerase-like uncharacterized protein